MNTRSLLLFGMFLVLFFVSRIDAPLPQAEEVRSSPAVTSSASTLDNQALGASVSEPLLQPISHIADASTPSESSPLGTSFSESTIWLARAIYSESKRPHEQELVAWVIRNRVETAYRGRTTYKGVVLDPYQFSAFNPGAPKRTFLMNLTPEMQVPKWQQSLWIAYYVRHADPKHRPFSSETRHFFSEISMLNRISPHWADAYRLVPPGLDYVVKEDRFRFYERIS